MEQVADDDAREVMGADLLGRQFFGLDQALKDAEGVNADEWTPRELRYSFVSLLSDRGVPLRRSPGWSGTPGRP